MERKVLLLSNESFLIAPQAHHAHQQGCSFALRGFTGKARHLQRPNATRAGWVLLLLLQGCALLHSLRQGVWHMQEQGHLANEWSDGKAGMKKNPNKAARTTELKAQSREQLSTWEVRYFMSCYFLSVTGLLLIRTDTIFRQSVIFKLMVSLKNLFWLSLPFMAQQFALTYPDSAKLSHVPGFKHTLKTVCCENTGILLSQEPRGKWLEHTRVRWVSGGVRTTDACLRQT